MTIEEKVKGVGRAARWLVPISAPDLESQLEAAKGYSEVRDLLKQNPENAGELEGRLKDYIFQVNQENYYLLKSAGVIDTVDKALVPVRVMGDVLSLFTAGAAGVTISSAKELIEAPMKLLYNAYYAAKTGDLLGTLYNLGYEVVSYIVPGSLLDLTNHYVAQAQKYSVKEGVKRFLEYAKGIKNKKVIDITDSMKPRNVEALIPKKRAA